MARLRIAAVTLTLPTVVVGCANDTAGAATWTVRDAGSVTAGTTSIRVLVTRQGCNGGVTGEVRPPEIDLGAAEVVVTYTVEATGSGGGTCQSDDAVPAVLTLPEAVGDRHLVDGGCQLGSPGLDPASSRRRESLCSARDWLPPSALSGASAPWL